MRTPAIQLWTVLAAFLAPSLGVPAHAEECLTDWGAAGEIVRREKLLTVQQLTQGEVTALPGQIVKTTLCKDGDDYIYKVVIRDPSGSLKSLVVDARPVASDSMLPAKSR